MLVPKLRFKREDGTEYPEWERKALSSVCDIVGGGTPSTEHAEYWNGDIQWFTPSEIGKTKYAYKSERTISNVGFEKSSARKLPVGTVLLTSRATLGEMAITTQVCTTNQGFQSLVPKDINNEYLYYLQPIIKNHCYKKACGSTFNEISKSELGKCIIPVPHSEEQQKIADFLSTVDEVIAQSEAEVENLEQQKKAAMQKIFSQEIRFKREDGSEYPEWETRQLHSVFIERNEVQTITGDAPLLSFTIEQGVINPEDKKTNKRDFLIKDKDNKKFALTEYNDIIYNPANLKYGAIHRNKLGRGVVSPIYAIFYTNESPVFMEYVVTNPTFIKKSLKYLEGTVIKLMTLKPRDFLLMKCNIPCLEEQQKIADFLSTYDETIRYAKQELDKWKELKKGLLQQMFV